MHQGASLPTCAQQPAIQATGANGLACAADALAWLASAITFLSTPGQGFLEGLQAGAR